MLALHRPDSEPIVLPSPAQQLVNAMDALWFLPPGSAAVAFFAADIPGAERTFRNWAAIRGLHVSTVHLDNHVSVRIHRDEFTHVATLVVKP